MIVLDASAVIELLLRTPTGSLVDRRISSDREPAHAPHLLDIEVLHVLRRHVGGGIISAKRAEEALQDLVDLLVVRHSQVLSVLRIWELHHNLTAYDAAYLSLAEVLDAPLVTCDSKIAEATNHRAKIEFIPTRVN